MRIVSRLPLPQNAFVLTGRVSRRRPSRRARRLQQFRLAALAGLHRIHQPAGDHRSPSRGGNAARQYLHRHADDGAGSRAAAAARCSAGAGLCLGLAAALHGAIQRAGATPAASVQVASAAQGGAPTTLGEQAGHISQSGGTHLVQSGDTAWNISRRYGISVEQLAAANGGSTDIKLGQRLAIPARLRAAARRSTAGAGGGAARQCQPAGNSGGGSARHRCREVPAAAAADTTPSQPPAEQQLALAPQTGAPGRSRRLLREPSAAAEASGFRWPVRGRVISGFGKKPDGERNDGINLAVPEGTSVKAAEDGTVIYAGNELKSYGNLVLIRHNNGWVSAYAHNSKLEVKRGDGVSRGQVIALSGMSGGVTTPQVHFELRKDATPVDPLQHLTES